MHLQLCSVNSGELWVLLYYYCERDMANLTNYLVYIMFELLQKMLGILQKQIIVIIEGGITVVQEEAGGILSIPREDMQIMDSSVMGTSLVRFRL